MESRDHEQRGPWVELVSRVNPSARAEPVANHFRLSVSRRIPQPVGQALLQVLGEWALGGDDHAGKKWIEKIAQQQAHGGAQTKADCTAVLISGSPVTSPSDVHVADRNVLRLANVEEDVHAAGDEGEGEQNMQCLAGMPVALVEQPTARARPSGKAVEKEAHQQGADARHK